MIEARTGRDGARVHRARVYYRGRYVASRTFARKRDAQEWERRLTVCVLASGPTPVRQTGPYGTGVMCG
jgi:hypothetical protein